MRPKDKELTADFIEALMEQNLAFDKLKTPIDKEEEERLDKSIEADKSPEKPISVVSRSELS